MDTGPAMKLLPLETLRVEPSCRTICLFSLFVAAYRSRVAVFSTESVAAGLPNPVVFSSTLKMPERTSMFAKAASTVALTRLIWLEPTRYRL